MRLKGYSIGALAEVFDQPGFVLGVKSRASGDNVGGGVSGKTVRDNHSQSEFNSDCPNIFSDSLHILGVLKGYSGV